MQPLERQGVGPDGLLKIYSADEVLRQLRILQGTRKDYARYYLVDAAGNRLREVTRIISGTARIVCRANDRIHREIVFDLLDDPLTLAPYRNVILADNPLFFIRMGEQSGATANDATANARHFTINGTAGTHYRLAQDTLLKGDSADYSIEFLGSASGFLSRASEAAFNFSGGFGLELAFKTSSGTGGTVYARDNGTTERMLNIRTNNNGSLTIEPFWSDATSNAYTTMSRVNDGMPHLFRLLYNKERLRAYIDYGLVLDVAQTKTLRSITQAIEIGKSFTGYISNVSLYPTGVTPEQARLHYQAAVRDLDQIQFGQDEIAPVFGFIMPDGGRVEFAQGVYVFTQSEWIRQQTNGYAVRGFDRSQKLVDSKLAVRTMFATGTNIIGHVKAQLEAAGIFQHNITPSSLTLRTDTEFDSGAERLDVINALLALANYYPLDFDWDGIAVSRAKVLLANRQPDYTLYVKPGSKLAQEQSVSLYGRRYRQDYFNTPNHIILFTGSVDGANLQSERFNYDLMSLASIPQRGGRIIGPLKEQHEASNQATLDAIADQRLEELSRVPVASSYPVTIQPHLWQLDLIRVVDDVKGKEFLFEDSGWDRVLSAGATETHSFVEFQPTSEAAV